MRKYGQNFAVLATDIAVFTIDGTDLKVLVTKAKSPSFKDMPTLPGGLVGYKERSEVAVRRMLRNALSINDIYLEQLYTFDDPGRDPDGRVVSVAYLGLVPLNKAEALVRGGAIWESVKHLPKLAYDHNEIVNVAVKRLKSKLTYTNVVFGLMPEEFSLTELQVIYENILGHRLDKRNFRKKIRSLKILEKLPKKRKGEANRPAQLYSFRNRKLEQVEIL